jgi:hypothetical protein
MTTYLVLIYGDEQTWAEAPDTWHQENGKRHAEFNAAAGAAVRGGNELERTDKAITIRLDPAGRQTVTDGPFVDTKEVVGGYYLIEAADREEAVRLARQIPEASSPRSGVEIRAVVGPS